NKEHMNRDYLLGVQLPSSIQASVNLRDLVEEKDFLIIAVPSLYFLKTIKEIVTAPSIIEGEIPIGFLTKGFIDTGQTPLTVVEAAEKYLPGVYKDNMVYISGPSHAEEVARGKITGLISASKNPKNSIRFRELLSGKTLLVFSSLDVAGVQTAAAVKNVIALAFGMLDALKEISPIVGDNTESLLLAAGLSEIQQIGFALGSTHPETFTSIAAVGDLDVTCRSVYGRNRRFGREIIHERKIEPFRNIDDLIESIDSIGYLPEGVAACKYAKTIVKEKKLKTPIIQAVYSILNRDSAPFDTISELLGTIPGVAK
ncbi:MAG TPA: glycerol-3-phosphate dehydrogenase, partial [Sediminispirochaeta sp.]|nr:glycerol-3-phosphate dehydrogenase [Sediminispirochaeta sp.]